MTSSLCASRCRSCPWAGLRLGRPRLPGEGCPWGYLEHTCREGRYSLQCPSKLETDTGTDGIASSLEESPSISPSDSRLCDCTIYPLLCVLKGQEGIASCQRCNNNRFSAAAAVQAVVDVVYLMSAGPLTAPPVSRQSCAQSAPAVAAG